MVAKVFSAEGPSLAVNLETVSEMMSRTMPDFDFLILSIHPDFPVGDVNYYVQKVFQTDKYLAFQSIDAFANDKIVQGIVALVLKFERKGNVGLKVFNGLSKYKETDLLDRFSDFLRENNDKYHVIISSPLISTLDSFIEDLNGQFAHLENVVGGVSPGFKDKRLLAYEFTKDSIVEDGFAVLSFENFAVASSVSLGFEPYGISYEVDHAEANRLYSVGKGDPFLNVVHSILRGISNPDLNYLRYCPVAFIDENGNVQNLRSFKDIGNSYVEFFGNVKRGQKFKLSFALADRLLDSDKKAVMSVKKDLKTIDLLLNFSCRARQYVLGSKSVDEVKTYMRIGNAPLFGFFTLGEIGKGATSEHLKLHNDTSIVVGIREL